jgi:hypothetical protein
VGQGGLAEEAVDAAHAAAVAVATLQLGAQLNAGDHAVSGAQLVDDLLDLGLREARRAGHWRIITENNGNTSIHCGPHGPQMVENTGYF